MNLPAIEPDDNDMSDPEIGEDSQTTVEVPLDFRAVAYFTNTCLFTASPLPRS